MDRLRELFNANDWMPAIVRLFEVRPLSKAPSSSLQIAPPAETRQYPVFTGPPLPRWNFDQRVVLAGDAAHRAFTCSRPR